VYFMPANAILNEATKLHQVSDRLDVIAGENATVSEALSVLSGNVRSSATLLQLVVALKLGQIPGMDSKSN